MQGCLHIVEQATGEFSGWSDSLYTLGSNLGPNVGRPPYSFEQYGDLAKVHTGANGNPVIELAAYDAMCCSHSFEAASAENGTVMKAGWPADLNQTPHTSEWKKMPGDSCIVQTQ